MDLATMVPIPYECMGKQGTGEEQVVCYQSDARNPTKMGEKMMAKEISDGKCLGCEHSKESIKHLF